MKILLDVKDSKARFIIELLENFNFVKAQNITSREAEILNDLAVAVQEVNLLKKSNQKSLSLTDFLNDV